MVVLAGQRSTVPHRRALGTDRLPIERVSAVGRETEQPGRAEADADSEQGAATPTTVVGGNVSDGHSGPGQFATS